MIISNKPKHFLLVNLFYLFIFIFFWSGFLTSLSQSVQFIFMLLFIFSFRYDLLPENSFDLIFGKYSRVVWQNFWTSDSEAEGYNSNFYEANLNSLFCQKLPADSKALLNKSLLYHVNSLGICKFNSLLFGLVSARLLRYRATSMSLRSGT